MDKALDSGREFEERALSIARAIHDPSGTQGSRMVDGQERDAVFVSNLGIQVYEFTVLRTVDKAQKDGEKIAKLLVKLRSEPENRFKQATGFFVTQAEPTADQRRAISDISKRFGQQIHCMSAVELRKQLIDTEEYIRLRMLAPFGSVDKDSKDFVEPGYRSSHNGASSLDELDARIDSGERIALVADFGSGKSGTLREFFYRRRKSYFKNPMGRRFPLHINLRECFGLKSAHEVIRRHADEVGFSDQNGLLAAWRAGVCDLLLDGFDELVPTRWVGGAKRLKTVRWNALECARELIEETPTECGVVIAGREQFFSSNSELLECVGMKHGQTIHIDDLSDDQVSQLSDGQELPDWVPRKPLLIRHILKSGLIADLTDIGSEAQGWKSFIELISNREATRVSTVDPGTFRDIMGRLATFARSKGDLTSPLSIDDMREVFREVCGFDAEEEGMQALLRLPGLGTTVIDGQQEGRAFVDLALASSVYGHDLGAYIQNPYDSTHPLSSPATTASSGSVLSAGYAASMLVEAGNAGAVRGALEKRMNDGYFDATTLDICLVSDSAGESAQGQSPFVDGVLVSELVVGEDHPLVGRATFKDCLFSSLIVDDDELQHYPVFESCHIDVVHGLTQMRAELAAKFKNSEPGRFDDRAQSTDALIDLDIDSDSKIALVILRKVFMQKGAARKFSALQRGLRPELRPIVGGIVDSLSSAGFLSSAMRKGTLLISPNPKARGRVVQILSAPANFRLDSLGRIAP